MAYTFDAHKNFAITTVTTAPTPATSGTSLVVSDATVFPATPFNATIWPASTQPTKDNAEIVRVTLIVGNTLTISRVQESSSARTVIVTDQIANTVTVKPFTDLEADLNITDARVTTTLGSYFPTQRFSGLRLRTHTDSDVAASKVVVTALDEVVMSDGARYQPTTFPIVGDIAVSGAGGLDTGAEAASVWYSIYVIGKSSTLSTADLKLLFHREKDYLLDQSQLTNTAVAEGLRADAGHTRKAQSFQISITGQVPFVDIGIVRTGTPVGNIWFQIEADSAGRPSGTALATSDKFNSAVISSVGTGYIRFPFRTPATLSSATTYHLVMYGDYAVSGANFIYWVGNTAGGYANGKAEKFDGAVWSDQATDLDMLFKIYVTRNSTSLAMPATYDQYCKIGYVYNNSGSNFDAFVTTDKFFKKLSTTASFSFPVVLGTNNIAQLMDASTMLPPIPCVVICGGTNTLATNNWVSGIPDGTNSSMIANGYDGGASIVFSAVAGANWHVHSPVSTDFQGVYVTSGNGTYSTYLVSFTWS